MLCKYCGKESDNGSEICSVCRDMLGVEEPEIINEAELPSEIKETEAEIFEAPSKVKKEKKAKKEKKEKEPKSPDEKRDLVSIIAIAMCALCLIVAVSSMYSAAKMRSELGQTMNYQIKELSNKNAELEARLASLEKIALEEEQAKKAAEEAKMKNFKILSAPSDETRELGYKSQPDHYLFGFIVEGSAKSFLWEKQLADGSWIPVQFDENGKCAEFGLSKLESVSDGFSKLVAEGLTNLAAGTYRCTAEGSYGGSLQGSVKLEVTQ